MTLAMGAVTRHGPRDLRITAELNGLVNHVSTTTVRAGLDGRRGLVSLLVSLGRDASFGRDDNSFVAFEQARRLF